MEMNRKWIARFAIVMVILNLSALYSNWRLIRAVQHPPAVSVPIEQDKKVLVVEVPNATEVPADAAD